MRFSFNTTAVAIAILVIIFSTAALSLLSYYYTVGRASVADQIQIQSNLLLTRQTVDAIEQKIIRNDRTLADMMDADSGCP
jgi:hypothetical protein